MLSSSRQVYGFYVNIASDYDTEESRPLPLLGVFDCHRLDAKYHTALSIRRQCFALLLLLLLLLPPAIVSIIDLCYAPFADVE